MGEPRGPGRGRAANFEGSSFSAFGSLVRQRRLELNLTMAAFAKRCDLDHTYISRIERGERPPPAPWALDQIVEALNLTPARSMRLYWAACVVPPFFRSPDLEEPIFEALRAIAESANPKRAIALLRLGSAASAVLETLDDGSVKIDKLALLGALTSPN